MRDDFASVETDTPYNPRRLSTRRHVPNLQRAFWMMERERERAVRFSNLEIEVLVDLIKTHILVEAGNLDSTSNAGKRKAWETITTEFWTRTSSNRTEYQLLKKWKNLKHAARKYEAAINGKEQLGPGRAPPPRSPIFEEVLDVIRKEQEALNCSRDITFYPTKVKIKEEIDSFAYPETNDDRLHTEQSTTWEPKRCITSQEEIPLNNQQHVQRIESDTSERSQHFVPNREPSVSIHKNAKRTDIVEDEGDASDDAISVGGCSIAMERAQDIDSTLPADTQQSPDEGISAVPSNLAHLVHEKTLALKSAQLALVEKEKKIKDLDIRIREEQLTDIIIRRKHEQELHELRKRRMLRGLSDC